MFYASPLTRTLRGTIQLLRETRYDLLYLNSFFDAAFTLRPLLVRRLRLVPNRPTVLAPRGEFSAGAFKIKLWKKAPFARLAHFFKLYAGITWHASTELEVADIQRVMGESEADIKVARNVAIAPDILADCAASAIIDDKVARGDKALSVCFLSRISPKKNLDFALKVLARVKAPVQFTIYGPLEQPAYWKMCQELIKNMPKHIAVSYGGSVQHDRVRSTLAKFDIFFLPTLGENFGHVFLEAWSAGVSVLISDQTPWRGLEKQQLGWDIPLQNPEEFVLALETAAKLSHRQRSQARTRCAQFARSKAEDPEALDLNRRLFWHALAADSPKPLR